MGGFSPPPPQQNRRPSPKGRFSSPPPRLRWPRFGQGWARRTRRRHCTRNKKAGGAWWQASPAGRKSPSLALRACVLALALRACVLALALRACVPALALRACVPALALRACGGWSLDHGEDVVLGHDEVLFAVDGDFAAGIGGEQDTVALADLEGGALAAVQPLALAQAQDLALLGLLLGGVRQDDAAGRLLFRLQALDPDLVIQG